MKLHNKLKALEDHVKDPRQRFECSGYDAETYFTSYLLLYNDSFEIEAINGAIADEASSTENTLRAEVRVGDYKFDGKGSEVTDVVPMTDNYLSMRNTLWEISWPAFKSAQEDYLEKCGGCVDSDQDIEVASFTKMPPVRYRVEPDRKPKIDYESWKRFMKSASKKMGESPDVLNAKISLTVENICSLYVNSEGTSIVQHAEHYYLYMSADAVAKGDGELLCSSRRHFTRDYSEIPSKRKISDEISDMIKELEELRNAPVQKPGSFPAIFDPDVTGVLFHEIVGHRLEGERQDSEWEGDTFEGKIGKKVAPDFVNLVDNPAKRYIDDKDKDRVGLMGHYKYDSEGVKASNVVLFDKGVLRNYLTSRKPIGGYDVPPNGHGRCDGEEDPVGRMSNLIAYSSTPLSPHDIRERLIEECAKQDKDYGLIFEGSSGGYTGTEDDFFKVFPDKTYRLYSRDCYDKELKRQFRRGDVQLVRGVEITGTPLIMLNDLVGMGDDHVVWPGVCGAESGWVKVCCVAPSSVFSNMEINEKDETSTPNPLPKPSTYMRKIASRKGDDEK
ncbi:MAG: TldD/PmbA family protein [Candidatus Woesearchaeota archaeon]